MRALSNSLRSLALCAAIGVSVFAWRAGVEPAERIVVAGKTVHRQEMGFFIQLALLVISSLIQYALAPKPPKPKPASLEDFDIPQTQAGASFAMFFGENLDESAVVGWYGSLSNKPIKAKGKK